MRFKLLILLFLSINYTFAQIPQLNQSFKSATVKTKGNLLVVSTGKVERTWRWTGKGFVTIAYKNLQTNKIWKNKSNEKTADWAYYGLIDNTNAKIVSLTAEQADDDKFTSDFLKVTAEVNYPSVESAVKYEIWVFPNANGLRTQLFIKGNGSKFIKDTAISQNESNIRLSVTKGKKLGASSVISDPKSVEFLLSNLNPKNQYTLGLSFKSDDEKELIQQIRATNIDRELKLNLIEKASSNNNNGIYTVNIPSKLLTDGSFRLYLAKVAGGKASINKIWIYENKQDNQLKLNRKDILDLQNVATKGDYLVFYDDFSKEPEPTAYPQYGETDFIPLNAKGLQRHLIGYYNDTQNRNTAETPLIKEITIKQPSNINESYSWANVLALEDASNGIMLVKESHKSINQYGAETGDFTITKDGIINRGTSLFPQEINIEKYKWCWATWSILYNAGDDNRQLAIKNFDKIRYPIDPSRDIYIQANTWGSGGGRKAASEKNILKELDIQQKLGIDIQQIDDGWQDKNWAPKTETYPNGWANVVQSAKSKNIKLGLWGAAMPITLDALKSSYDNGQFVSYKLDFANLSNHDKIDETINKVRSFIDYTNHKIRVNWDVTENAPRFGFYWAREYGCIYLENRKPEKPESVIYTPYLVLRDIWHLSKYTNIQKFQTTIQNVTPVNRKMSDAYKHSNAYATAIGLIGTPLFFQETQYYSEEDIKAIEPILSAYKKHRVEIYKNYTFPIGHEPNNAAYTGFQNYTPSKKNGYLFLFRELNNKVELHKYQLSYIKKATLLLTNIITNKQEEVKVDRNGFFEIGIPQAGDFKILKFQVK